MRPRRKRKLTNYGEGHLHWIEESQLHKALMKSLREKSGKNSAESENEEYDDTPEEKMPRIFSRTSNASPKLGRASSSRTVKWSSSSNDDTAIVSEKTLRKLRSNGGSNSSSCDLMMSHATMMQPRNSDGSSKDSKSSSRNSTKSVDIDIENSESASSPAQNLKTRAQRKFASNSSQNPRNGSRIERKLKKSNRSNINDKCEPISDKPLPDTKDFINHLCFRNTPFHFELEDGRTKKS